MKRAALLAVGALLMIAVAAMSSTAQPQSVPTVESLRARVQQYYAALMDRNFSRVWDFFAESMKRDNPKDDYVKSLYDGSPKVLKVGSPEIKLDEVKPTRPDEKRGTLIGRVRTRLSVVGPDGKAPVNATHQTTWVWERPANRADGEWASLGGPLLFEGEQPVVLPPRRR